MKLYLTSAYPMSADNFGPQWLKRWAKSDPFGKHQITDDPHIADLIVFVENHPWHDPYFFRVLRSSLYRKYRRKCFLYHDHDYVVPLVRGIYPSIEKRYYQKDHTRSLHYLARMCVNESIIYSPPQGELPYLFSFVGSSRTHAVRREILKLSHSRCILKDTAGQHAWLMDAEAKTNFEDFFASTTMASKFVLCPRGIGTATYRLFETMEMGRAAVIISDEWVPFAGPDWEAFSIRVREKDVRDILGLLEAAEPHWKEMGAHARREWEKWISPEVSFHRLAEACAELHAVGGGRSVLSAVRPWLRFSEPFHFINLLRYFRNNYWRKALAAVPTR